MAILASSKPDPCQHPHCQVHCACGSWHKDELGGDPELHGTEPCGKVVVIEVVSGVVQCSLCTAQDLFYCLSLTTCDVQLIS